MTTPSLRSLLMSVRRYWWVPLIAALGVLGLTAAWPGADPARVTSGDVLFTVAAADPGQDADGAARVQESSLAEQRLGAYSAIVSRSAAWQDALREAQVEVPELNLLSSVTPSGDRLALAPGPAGLLTIRLENEDLGNEQSTALVGRLQRIVAEEFSRIDSQQDQPSFTGDPVVLPAQAAATSLPADSSLVRDVVMPLLAGFVLGLGIVYLLDWRLRRVEDRGDLENRLQVGVLGESLGRPGDFEVLASALKRGRSGESVAILAAAPGTRGSATVVEGVTHAITEVPVTTVGEAVEGMAALRTPFTRDEQPTSGTSVGRLTLIDLSDPVGVHAPLIAQAPTADVIAILVEYGHTPMRDLESMLIRLSDVCDTPLRVVGLKA